MKNNIAAICLIFAGFSLNAQDNLPAIVPKPVQCILSQGTFVIDASTTIVVDNPVENLQDAEWFAATLSRNWGIQTVVTANPTPGRNVIRICRNEETLPADAYRMKVTPDSVVIRGAGAGAFYALQTLRQLIPGSKAAKIHLPCLEIYDYPRFAYRGMHLDVCRHFFTVEEVKQYIDNLAAYKMNVFHWHLTDDQGWRIMIHKYPKLALNGGFRNTTLIGHYSDVPRKFDSSRYGGYYTQDEIREVVRYAGLRHVTVIPEIEMPGHSMAAISAYPQYSCTGGPFEVAGLWGVFDDVFCTKDSTLRFMEDILSEVISLFPGPYIHIGGDECPKTRWEKCPRCLEVMKREGLSDGHQLQSYFIRNVGKFVNAHGKTIIGWDEILEGGLAPDAVVMSWRGTEGGLAAARQNHGVIMCPGGYCYFDHYQGNPASEPLAIGGNTTTEKVYSFEPVPDGLNPEQQKFILGAQGNVWTEYIDNFGKVEYMSIPRMIALSEVLWSPAAHRNYSDFCKRLEKHFQLLDLFGVNHARITP